MDGLKTLTPHNWAEPDPVNHNFWRESRALRAAVAMDGDGWAREFLRIQLPGHVAAEIRTMFEVARGAAVYGWFYYPLFRLAEEQLLRVMEAAAKARYAEIRADAPVPNFHDAISHLTRWGVIAADDAAYWKAVRQGRNRGSHATRQTVVTPGQVLGVFDRAAQEISRLFARSPSPGAGPSGASAPQA